MSCKHSCWINLKSVEREVFLENHKKMGELVDGFINPAKKTPSLISVLEGKNLRSQNILSREQELGKSWLRLQVVPSAIKDRAPLLFSTLDLDFNIQTYKDAEAPKPCHEQTTNPLSWLDGSRPNIQAYLNSLCAKEILYPFTDVFCCFANDLGGLHLVKNWLALLKDGQQSKLRLTRPRLVVISEKLSREGLDLFQADLQHALVVVNDLFASVRVVGTDQLSSFDDLAKVFASEAKLARRARQKDNLLFSGVHFAELVEQAVARFTRSDEGTFDVVKATLAGDTGPNDFPLHIRRLLSAAESENEVKCLAPIVVASAMVMGGVSTVPYFSASLIFERLYRDKCLAGFRSHRTTHTTEETWCAGIQEELAVLLPKARSAVSLESFLRENVSCRYGSFCEKLKSSSTCFVCLSRGPDTCFPCGHGSCEPCFLTLGSPVENQHYAYSLDECVFCGQNIPNGYMRIKPPTAGARILSIDGGGIRGIIPLQFLRELEDYLGLPWPVQENFDVAFGTSSGGLIVFGLFANGWGIGECEDNFVSFSREAFTPRLKAIRLPFLQNYLGRILNSLQARLKVLVSLIADSQYTEGGIEDAVQKAFGRSRGLLDLSYAHSIGSKIGVTSTTTKKSSPRIFVNYRRAEACETAGEYKAVVPKLRAVNVWEAARCTTAAPWFFKACKIPGVGTFQDGGLWKNNPVDIAEKESRKIWPKSSNPDIVLSVGTGMPECPTTPISAISPTTPLDKNFSSWKSRFVPRLYSSFMNTLDGEKAWTEIWNRLGSDGKARYYRLNLPLKGQQPVLDDISQMQALKESATWDTALEKIPEIASRIVSSMFFFELAALPSYMAGKYLCNGFIYCRASGLPADTFRARLNEEGLAFFVEDTTINLSQCGPSQPVELSFTVPNLASTLTISLGKSRTTATAISGCPLSLEKLIEIQQLNRSFFGAAYNLKRRNQLPSSQKRCKRIKC